MRIKRGVRPYGGRRVEVVREETYRNGRRVVWVRVPLDTRHTDHGHDIREYEIDEVEEP